MDFAKLFGGGKEQILVVFQKNKEGAPEITIFHQVEPLVLASVEYRLDNNDEGWKVFGKYKNIMTEDIAKGLIKTASALMIKNPDEVKWNNHLISNTKRM